MSTTAEHLAQRFRKIADPSFGGTWREACDLLDELVATEPKSLPLDPMDLDRIPPEDIDACPSCQGIGAIWPSSDDPRDVRDCATCDGTGVTPEPYGVAS